MNSTEYVVMYRDLYSQHPHTYGAYETLDQAQRAARKASKDERVSTASVECGRGLDHRSLGTWMRGKKVS